MVVGVDCYKVNVNAKNDGEVKLRREWDETRPKGQWYGLGVVVDVVAVPSRSELFPSRGTMRTGTDSL